MPTTIKVSAETRDRIKSVSASTGLTPEQVVSRALLEYERMLFWGEDAQGSQPERTHQERDEQELWEHTLRDGLSGA